MKTFQCSSNHRHNWLSLEINEKTIESQLIAKKPQYHYLRHIPSQPANNFISGNVYKPGLKSSDRQGANQQVKDCYYPRQDKVFINLKLQIQQDRLNKIYLKNLRNNLEKRLKSAQSAGDEKLIALLKQESQELALDI